MVPPTVSELKMVANRWPQWRQSLGRRLLGMKAPIGASDWRPSLIASLVDDPASQTHPELAWILRAIATAASLKLVEAPFLNVFPGEHYRLLAGLILELQPELVLEIGTYTGMSARVICDYSPANCSIHTFDLLAWDGFESYLSPDDFQGQRLQQHLDNLAFSEVFNRYSPLLDQAQLIFCDAPKDGIFEPAFLSLLAEAELSQRPRWLLLDDIRLLPMVECWRSISSPKLDLTSFGHWSGTGIVDISLGLKLQR